MINSKVIYCRAGGGAGSVILIEYDQENSKYTMFVYCAWRIEKKNKVITTSADDPTANIGPMAKGVRLLEGLRVLSIEMSRFYDLCIKFENDMTLNMFCDISSNNILLTSQNWDFSIINQDISFEITENFKIKKGKYYQNH